MKEKIVDPELYDFLKENETGLYLDYDREEVIAYVHINFYDLSNFVKVVGEGYFDEGGADVAMFPNTICIEINDIINDLDQSLYDYKGCFNKDDWRGYDKKIKKDWGEIV